MTDPAADGLIHVADYRWVTGDQTTPSANVERALDEALNVIESNLNRKLAYGTHTEDLYVYRDGKVYPTNTPLDTVTTPAVAATAIQGAGVYLGTFTPTPEVINVGDWQTAFPPQTTITYTGGFQPVGTTDGPTDELPVVLFRAICRVAYLILHPVVLAGVPVGAKAASVGDVSMTGDLTGMVALDSGVAREIKPYRKRPVRGWQRT